MKTPIKIELYHGTEVCPFITHYYDDLMDSTGVPKGYLRIYVPTIQEDFRAWVDFPTQERLKEVFITNKQSVFEMLYLNGEGDIVTVIKFTKE